MIVQIIKLKYLGDKVKGRIENIIVNPFDSESVNDFIEYMISDLEDGYVLTYNMKQK